MSRYDRPTFNPVGKFEARRAFTYNGVKYAPAQSFPWNKIACSPRKLRDLFNGNFITPTVEKPSEKKPSEKKTKKSTGKKANKSEEISSDAEITEFLNDQSD